ncbi:hypothetical protein AB0331_17845 [Dietzia maris]|uniref:hypothetical protein n=1 Tax=Dietzia maris TaxID=37915 RepID=UPI00344EAF2C
MSLHPAAYLLHADTRIGRRRGNQLLVGPHRPYLDDATDVLHSVDKHSVQTATVADLASTTDLTSASNLTDAADHPGEPTETVAALKSTSAMVDAIEAAVRFYEQLSAESMTIRTEWIDLRFTPAN